MTQIEQVMAILKRRILSGDLMAGSRLMEVPIAEQLGVSRTPVRHAFALLEREGLVSTQGPKRGFVVRSFDPEEVFETIAIRGTLEGMAARLTAERRLTDPQVDSLNRCIETTAALISQGIDGVEEQKAWVQANVDFHSIVVGGCGNRALLELIGRLNTMPLVGPAAINFATDDPDGDLHRFRRVFEDHSAIAQAIVDGEGTRAEMLTREHAYRNVQNKRLNLSTIQPRIAAPV